MSKELEERLVSMLGGRAAEELVFGDVTTGAQNDIEQATNIAKSMVTLYGMSESFGLMGLAKIENQYLSGRSVMDCSDQTAALVDKEVERDPGRPRIRPHSASFARTAWFWIRLRTS